MRAEAHGRSGVKQIIAIDPSGDRESQRILLSLVDTKNQARFSTERQIEALYFVRTADYGFTRTEGSFRYIHNTLKHIRDNRRIFGIKLPCLLRTSTQAYATTSQLVDGSTDDCVHPHLLSQHRRLSPPYIVRLTAKAKRSIHPSSRTRLQSLHRASQRPSHRRQMRGGGPRKLLRQDLLR